MTDTATISRQVAAGSAGGSNPGGFSPAWRRIASGRDSPGADIRRCPLPRFVPRPSGGIGAVPGCFRRPDHALRSRQVAATWCAGQWAKLDAGLYQPPERLTDRRCAHVMPASAGMSMWGPPKSRSFGRLVLIHHILVRAGLWLQARPLPGFEAPEVAMGDP